MDELCGEGGDPGIPQRRALGNRLWASPGAESLATWPLGVGSQRGPQAACWTPEAGGSRLMRSRNALLPKPVPLPGGAGKQPPLHLLDEELINTHGVKNKTNSPQPGGAHAVA